MAEASQVERFQSQPEKLWLDGQAEVEDGLFASQSYLLGRATAGRELLVPLLVGLPSPPLWAEPQLALLSVFLSAKEVHPDLRCAG